jgi:hypothetical protein
MYVAVFRFTEINTPNLICLILETMAQTLNIQKCTHQPGTHSFHH